MTAITGIGRDRLRTFVIVIAASTALMGWVCLAIECLGSVGKSLGHGYALPEALFLFLRFFTILTNIGIAALMTATALALLRRRPLPSPVLYHAGLLYAAVTCATYEIMLRRQWHPRGWQYVNDLVFHDVAPALMLVLWLVVPPTGGRWRDALSMLVFPAVYFVVTLVAGALGEGYPYGFIDVDKLGYPAVLTTAVTFVAIFYLLGLAIIAASRTRTVAKDDRSMAA